MNWIVVTCMMCKGAKRDGIGGRMACPCCGGTGGDRYLWQVGRWWVGFVYAAKGPRSGWFIRVAGEERAPVESVSMVWEKTEYMHIGRGRERYQDVDVVSAIAEDVVRELDAVIFERAKSPKQCRFSFASRRTG